MACPPAWQGTHPIATANTFLEASWRLLTHKTVQGAMKENESEALIVALSIKRLAGT
jgi:predicted nuclease with RNAse H fold